VDAFPGLTADGLTITCDRQRALAREDFQFLTWDHPLVTGALDLFLGSEKGNSSFARWADATAAGLYLEAVFLLECIAPPSIQVDRFLPPTPLRVLVDQRGNDAGGSFPANRLAPLLTQGESRSLLAHPELQTSLLPKLLEKAQQIAALKVPELISKARDAMAIQLTYELERLRGLQRVNRSVRDEEIDLLVQQQDALETHIAEARLRLDSLRVIHRGSPQGHPTR
jgi:ATP-dependent helicase HepA